MPAARAEGTELEPRTDVRRDLAHDERPEPATLLRRGGGDGLDVAGSQRPAVDLEHAFDDRGMTSDHAVEIEHDVEPTERVLPVVVGEPFLLVVAERRVEHRADRKRRLGRQLGRGHPAKADRSGA